VVSGILAGQAGALAAPAGPAPSADNDLGRSEIVLPGFSPVEAAGTRIELGGRRVYDWAYDPLPRTISAQGREVARSLEIVATVGGQERVLQGGARLTGSVAHHAELRATSTTVTGITVDVSSRVEYDGVTVVDVDVSSPRGLTLDALAVQFTVPRRPEMKLMAFDPASMYNFRPYFFPECYSGDYKSVLGFVYGHASFWWFADELDQGLLGARPDTAVECSGTVLRVTQPLLTRARRLDRPLRFRFGFLATPVRDLDGSFRRDRYTSLNSPAEGNRNLWWVDATAHYALPYLDYPPGAKEKLPAGDRNAYPGAAWNRKAVADARRRGLERLPYTSFRSLSFLDPEIGRHEAQWQVLPPIVTAAASDGPFRTGFPRAILSHRGPGFSDYLLSRLGSVADGLGVRGFYFDQAAPAGSTNPAHLLPGMAPGSFATDILAMRSFLKRLATMLYEKNGAPPLVYVHNSSAAIIPAFTFVTGMVQGEELIPEIRNLDYQGTFDLDRIRASYAPGAFGVPTVWLEELWSQELVKQRPPRYVDADQATWLASPEYRRGWRNFMALAALHDIPVWTLAPLDYRRQVYRQLDRFGFADSRFVGYWDLTRAWRDSPLLLSAYVHQASGRALLVAANRGDAPRQLDPRDIPGLVNYDLLRPGGTGTPRPLDFGTAALTVPGRDFLLIESK
jgi:hypothetical protein